MNSFGRNFRISVFGESHGEMIGVVIDGVPAGISLDIEDFTEDLLRRKAGARGTTPRIEGDITKVDLASIPHHDILCAGFPCQPFSQAGKQEGFEDSAGRGVLFNYIADIIRYRRPKYIFLENVANLKNHDGGRTWSVIYDKLDKELDYDIREIILSPHEFGLPQHRKRIYIVGINREYGNLNTFQFPEIPSNKPVCDINSIIEKDPVDIELIRPQYREYLRVWQEFLDECSKTGYIDVNGVNNATNITVIDGITQALDVHTTKAVYKYFKDHEILSAAVENYEDRSMFDEKKNTFII